MSDEATSSPATQRLALLPDWISSALLEETKSVWRSEYGEDLTTAEAVGLLQTMGCVFDILREDEDEHGDDE